MPVRPLKSLFFTLIIVSLTLASCEINIWQSDIESFVDEGLSAISLSSYDSSSISSGTETSGINVNLVNSRDIPAAYTITPADTETEGYFSTTGSYSVDSSSALSEKKISLTLAPDSSAEWQDLNFTLNISATEFEKEFTPISLTFPCNTPPNSITGLTAGASTTDAVSEAAFTLPSGDTDSDILYMEITYNINGEDGTTTTQIEIDDETYKSSQTSGELDFTPEESDNLRYFSPPGAASTDQYDYSIVVIDEGGNRSEAVTATNTTEYIAISYDTNGGDWEEDSDPGTTYVVSGGDISLPDNSTVSYGAVNLDSWSDGIITGLNPGGTVSGYTEDTVFTAQWENAYNLTLWNGTSYTQTAYTSGTEVALSVLSDSEGTYTFAGWDTDPSADMTVYFVDVDGDDNNYLEITDHTTLYAVWVTEIPIRTLGEMELISGEDYRDEDFILMKDINLGGSLGTTNPFSGTFNGSGYTLSNLSMSADVSDGLGLFGTLSGTVKDLTIENATIIYEEGGESCGILAGYVTSTGKISNCHVTLSDSGINSTDSVTGGLVGTLEGGTIENSTFTGSDGTFSSNSSYVGGIAGKTVGGTISHCQVNLTGEISGAGYVGGLVGEVTGETTIEQSCVYGEGTVSASGDYAGGFIGALNRTGTVSIDQCYANVTVSSTSTDTAGGFMGILNTGLTSLTISNSYFKGTIPSGTYGFVGAASAVSSDDSASFTDCYVVATDGSNDLGFMTDGNASISLDNTESCYYQHDSSDPTSYGEGVVSSTLTSPISGWSSDIWDWSGSYNNNYPYLINLESSYE
ncbi:MAG: GLUG motif-containing protein [Spirochaetales bacterium]|nr:GLUG motif-containing protein [Spirochaetales bacterium]